MLSQLKGARVKVDSTGILASPTSWRYVNALVEVSNAFVELQFNDYVTCGVVEEAATYVHQL